MNGAPIHRLFEQQVDRSPDAVAVVFGERRVTYRELDERANRVARLLRGKGVGHETLVGVCLDRTPALVEALLGVWKAGGAYVPLDPIYPRERLGFMVKDAQVAVVVTERKHREVFSDGGAPAVSLDDEAPALSKEEGTRLSSETGPSSLAYVMYTSGSTGQPKGAMILHGGLANYLEWAIQTYGLEPGGSVPVHSSIAFDLTVTSLYPALLAGGEVELLPEDVGAQNLVAALRRRPRNLVKITPAHLAVLTQQLRREELAGLTKLFVIGGENLTAESLDVWRDHAPGTRLVNEYGPTETVVGCCIHEVKSGDPRSGSVPIGRPIANTELHVLDDDRKPVEDGAMGELYIGGAGVARGYWNRAELTRDRFLPDTFSGREGARLYKTGDLARRRPDGTLEFLGRADDQVKIRGYRIELGEIEAVLAGHPDVQACAVVAREDAPGDKQIVGYVAPREGRAPAADELQAFLLERLPEYMTPAHLVFLDALPLTPNGKVDRKALPAPSAAAQEGAPNLTPPASETERALAEIWKELLRAEHVGLESEFFDLGGHSLLAIKVLARIRDTLGVDLPLQTLFEHSTLGEIAACVTEAKGPSPSAAEPAPPVAPAAPAEGPRIASFAQQQLWLLDQLVPGTPAYNIVDYVVLRGPYRADAAKKALAELVRRHETLRTSFSRDGGDLMQNVAAPFEPDVPEVDLGGLSADERKRRFAELVREQGRRPFDLAELPLFRATAVHLSPDEHRLLFTIHHVIGDEWSMDVLQTEVSELYAALAAGRPSPLPPLAMQYAAFAAEQRERLKGEARGELLAYWKRELEGATHVLALPTDKPRPPTPSLEGSIETFTLPAPLLEKLQALGQKEHATLFMTLEAAFAALLHRYTGQDDLLVGTPISERTRSETQKLIGCFLNTVVLRTRFEDDPSFRSLLRQTRTRALGAYAHAELPFEQLVAEVSPERDFSRAPLFQVMFVVHSRDGLTHLSKLSERAEIDIGTSKFDLTLYLTETPRGLEGLIEYATDLFDAGTVRRLARAYASVLEEVARDPDRSVATLPMPAEELAELRRFNETAADYPRDATVIELFRRQAQKTPDAPAVRAGEETATYRELGARASRIARALRRRGVGRGSFVGISLGRSIDMVAAVLGVLEAGAAYVPMDPAFPPARLAFMAEDSGLSVVVSESEHASRHGAPKEKTFELDRARAELEAESAEPLARDDRSSRPEDPAYVLYTSGSTGKPKGVLVHQRGAVNVITSIGRGLPGCTANDRWLAVTTLSFDIALLELLLPLAVGGQVVLATRDDATDAEALKRLIDERAITIMQATPATWRMLVDSEWKGRAGMKVISGGEPLAPDLAEALLERTAEVWNNYGPTETTVYSTAGRITDPKDITIGRPIANTSVWLLDRRMQPCPIGALGEIHIGGDGVSLGYLNRPELSKERFVPDPFGAAGGRLYKTGDLGRLREDGRIDCLGRTDFQVKVRGFRIELGEIEARLSEHPAVREACVVVAEPTPGDPSIVAYYALRPGQSVTSTDLRTHLRATLPDYMVPRLYVDVPELPRLGNGKVDRKSLPAPFAPAEAGEVVAPRTDNERIVAEVWQELLGRGVGVHDNFFDAGGHSLLVVRAIAAIAKRTGAQLSPRVFVMDTLAQIAAALPSGEARPAAAPNPPAPEPEERGGLLKRLKNRFFQ